MRPAWPSRSPGRGHYNDVRPLYEAAYASAPQIKDPRILSMLKLPHFDKAFASGQRVAQLEGNALQPGEVPDLRAMDCKRVGNTGSVAFPLAAEKENMPAKTTRRVPDAQADLIALSTAHAEAYGWAEKAVALRQDGKGTAAQAAERKARAWLRKAMAIETRYPPMTPDRHMTTPDR